MNLEVLLQRQRYYLESLEAYFAEELREFASSGLDLADFIASGRLDRRATIFVPSLRGLQTSYDYKVGEFLATVDQFWQQNETGCLNEIASKKSLRNVIWPESGFEESVPKLALYFDTILLPDPMLNFTKAIRSGSPAPLARHNAFSWLVLVRPLKPLLTISGDFPPLMIFPHQRPHSEPGKVEEMHLENNALNRTAYSCALHFLRKCFGISEEYQTPAAVAEKIIDLPEHSMNEHLGGVCDFFSAFINLRKNIATALPSNAAVGVNEELLTRLEERKIRNSDIAFLIAGVFGLFTACETRQANSAALRSDDLLSDWMCKPVMWKNRFLEGLIGKRLELNEEKIVARSFETKFAWLQNVSVEDCLKLREAGILQDFRTTLRVGREILKGCSIDDFDTVSKRFEESVIAKIHEQERLQEEVVTAARKRSQKAYISFGIAGTIGVSALAFPAFLPLAIGSAAYGLIVGGASVLDIVKDHRDKNRLAATSVQKPISFLAARLNASQGAPT